MPVALRCRVAKEERRLMDVGALFKGKGGGKGKGMMGNDKKFSQMLYRGVPKARIEGTCSVRGEDGHKEDQCWLKVSQDVGKGKE